MALGPFRSEQIYDPQFEDLVENICLRPWMYAHPPTAGSILAFLEGFNLARDGGPLLGFHEWLVLRLDGWNNLPWCGLLCRVVAGDHGSIGRSEDREVIAKLGSVVREYLEYRHTNGLTKVYFDYGCWLQRQDWYSGPLCDAEEDSL